MRIKIRKRSFYSSSHFTYFSLKNSSMAFFQVRFLCSLIQTISGRISTTRPSGLRTTQRSLPEETCRSLGPNRGWGGGLPGLDDELEDLKAGHEEECILLEAKESVKEDTGLDGVDDMGEE